MAVTCPNKNTDTWKELAAVFGDNISESLYYQNGKEIPDLQKAVSILRGKKVGEFKNVVRHLEATTSSEQTDLVPQLSQIVHQVGDDLYVVKGSRLTERPTAGAEKEIHTANLKFLNSVNENFGPIFKLTKVPESDKAVALGDKIVSDIANGEFEGTGYAKIYKDSALKPENRDQVLNDLVDQVEGGEANVKQLQEAFGDGLVSDLQEYADSIGRREGIKRSKVFSEPNPETAKIAKAYKLEKGIQTKRGSDIEKVDTTRAKKIADEFANMANKPNDPAVKSAYTKMVSETVDQYNAVSKAGYTAEIYKGEGEPYKNSAEMIADVRDNKHMFILSTEKDFGQNSITEADRKNNPLLADSGVKDVNGQPLLVNDLFRFVHDFFGHTERGNSFGPIGEENAWDVHSRLYSPEARRAMTTETRGQNSFVNFGAHMRDAEGNLIKKGEPGYLEASERPFAEQKLGLLPEEYSANDDVDNLSPVKAASGTYKVEIDNDALKALAVENAVKQDKATPAEQADTLIRNEKIMQEVTPKYSKAYNDSQTGVVNFTVLKYLGRKFNIPFEVVHDTTADWRGKFENGKVTINASKVDAYTELHEYLHPFTSAMEKDNAPLYKNLMEELQGSDRGKEIIEQVKKTYPELSAKDQLDEALVTHLSELSRTREIQSRPWYEKLMNWFRSMFGNNGISISDLSMNMTLNDIADKIIDPSYTADLKKYQDFNNTAVAYQKENETQEYSDNFRDVLEKVKTKLRLDTRIPARSTEEQTRKYFSGRQLTDLEANQNVYRALNDYVTSAIKNAKTINEKFEQFKALYEGANGKLDREHMLKGMNTLSEMENHVALYNESRFVIDAIRQENADEYEDNFSVLKNRLDGDTAIISNYHQYGLKLMSDWLYPTMKKTIDNTIKAGNIHQMPGYDEYVAVKALNPNMDHAEQIEKGVKMWIKGQMEHATTDIGFFNSYMSGVLNSKDPIGQLVGLSLKEEFAKNNTRLYKVKTSLDAVIKKATGKKIFISNADHKEFYKNFVHQVDSWEKSGYDDNGNAKFEYVKRTAFHEPYRYDQFYKAKREMFEKLGVRPNKNDEVEYQKWIAKRDAWFDEHSVREYNKDGEVVRSTPSEKYRNPEYAKVQNDPVFKEVTKHYNDANDKLGKYQMKYGIVPQQEVEGGLLKGLSKDKSAKENIDELKNNVKDSISSRTGGYYAQDIDGKEYKNVPIRYTRPVPEDRLSHNFAKSVADFYESSSKFASAKNIEPMVMTLRNFIEGNSFLKLNERDAPEIDAKGAKRMGNFVKNITKTKDQPNINRQLVDFLNDTIYGESEKKANIKSPFLNLKYMVHKEGDTSVNGKPHREYIYSLEDLKQKTGSDTIDHDQFTKGVEKSVNGYGVTLLQNDKILSVNKLSKKLNSMAATINLGGNVIAGTSHLLRGVASNFIEATGGKYFNNKEWVSAYKEYFKNLTNFSFLEDTRGGKGSKISQLLTHYGTFQGETLNEFGKHIGQGVFNKLFRRSSLFFSIHGAEHMIQTTQMIAAMKHAKLADGKTSLFDAWEKGSDGYIKIKDGLKWDDKSDNHFKDLIQSINKDRGNYSEFDKAGLSRLWWGKMLIMFRRHIFNGVKSRFGASYVDYERGGATQGYYRSFMTTLSNELNEFRLNGKFRKLTPDEAYHMKKTLADIGLFATLATVLVPAFRNDDEEKNGWDDYAALFARRLQMDVSFFYDPLEWKKVIQSPVVTGSTIDKMYEFASQAAISPSETYEKDGTGYRAGDNKAIHKLTQLIPGYRTIVNGQVPQDLLKFYDLKSSSTSK